jgi:superfamily II DNA or RNA helicase
LRTYGSVGYDDKSRRWLIRCEPHVMLRLKRSFPKVKQYSYGVIALADTVETARDLEWFNERFPLEFSDIDRLKQRAAEHREQEALIQRLLDRRQTALEFTMAQPAREYQKLAAALLLGKGSLLLADDVGLGKTCAAIASFTDSRTLPALVITLAHLPMQWEREIQKFMPQLRTHILTKGSPYDISAARGMFGAMPDVIITNYHKITGWAETLAPIVRSVIFDECQELRHAEHNNKMTAKYAASKHIADAAAFRMGLSATPIYNYGGEIFNVLDVISPGALGAEDEFKTEWCRSSSWSNKVTIDDPKAFGQYARDAGLMLRRTRVEVGRELPSITKAPQYIAADEHALQAVSESCAALARFIVHEAETVRGQKMQASEELSWKLRQATGVAKAPYVAGFVKLLLESEEKVVLYGWHREVYSIWGELLKEFHPSMYTGSESAQQKDAARHDFITGHSRVLMMSLRSGAGLDGLQECCRNVVFGELDWSPGVHEQCIGRVHRDGQKEPVIAYFLIAESGSDPVVADVLGLKAAQIEGVRDPNQELVTKLQTDGNHARRLAEAYLQQQGNK